MKTELYNYDIFPKVIPVNRTVEVIVRPLGRHSAFSASVRLEVCPLQGRIYPMDDAARERSIMTLAPDTDGCLRFSYAFPDEQEYFIVISDDEKRLVTLSVYAVLEDLACRIPLMGDLHLHTCRSDGKEDPAIVAAHLRSQGYDYIAITDHYNFFGALECMEAYRDVPIEMHLMTGEEVHLPDCHLHCVHIGGRYSVNAMVDTVVKRLEKKYPDHFDQITQAVKRMETAGFPGTMTEETFRRTIMEYADTLPEIPAGIPRYVYAGFCWICDQIRKAGGLSIFPHPYWIHGEYYHGDERLTQYMFDQKPFDAFEVLGGENYFQHNGFQTVHYYEAMAKGLDFPIVGSSDSHSSVNNRNAFIARTIAFAKKNDTDALLDAIREGYTLALDAISTENRLVGDFRLVKYGWFLMEHYFPLHQQACFEQGRAMKEYYCGDRSQGRETLVFLNGRIARMWKKYFAFDCL